MKVCGYTYNGPKKEMYDAGFECSFLRPDNYALYKKLIELWGQGYGEVIRDLLKEVGYEVSTDFVEKMFKEAKERIEVRKKFRFGDLEK